MRARAAEFDQEHLFAFWNELDEGQRSALLADVERIDFGLVQKLSATGVTEQATYDPKQIEAPEVLPADPTGALVERYATARERGVAMLRASKVAAMVVAGGQGTRLGYDAPKGSFPIGPVSNKSLFQLFAENIRASQQRYGCRLPWYIMTSEATDADTRTYFEENKYFGLEPGEVTFFQQGVMPAVDDAGRILLAERHRVALSPNGHGGSLTALAERGVLDDLAMRGVEALSYFQVDNPLIAPADPLFIGLHALEQSQMSSIAVVKVDDLEKVGNFAKVGGKLQVIEYSDLPEELARAKNPDGTRMLNGGSVAIHMLAPQFVRALTGGGALQLPWHIAHKKVAHIDLSTGKAVQPDKPNARKFEMFIFDAIPLAERTLVLEQHRRDCFSPVKNATGVDSPETARRDLVRRALRWLAESGVKVPPEQDGEPAATVEISPLRALDAEQLRANAPKLDAVQPGARLMIE
ncbi:MAG TPA: UDPGP type 1 family protein [Phycisphaerae bacterium]|nr:UDPGP type 1 family protein [Phycisphaerales bacterium]HRX86117.1 UDPGP type 1 family protein [Phycisphaerae bacterium]